MWARPRRRGTEAAPTSPPDQEHPHVTPLTRRALVRGGIAATALPSATLSGAGGRAAAAAVAGVRSCPTARDSYFRSTILGAAVDAAAHRDLPRFMRTHPEQNYRYPRINGVEDNEWGTAYAMGGPRMPVWRLVGEHNPKAERPVHATASTRRNGWGRCSPAPTTHPCASSTAPRASPCSAPTPSRSGGDRIRATAAAVTYHSSNGLDHRNPLLGRPSATSPAGAGSPTPW